MDVKFFVRVCALILCAAVAVVKFWWLPVGEVQAFWWWVTMAILGTAALCFLIVGVTIQKLEQLYL